MNQPTALEKAQALLSSSSPSWEHLVERITQLLATDPHRLIQILYQVDVGEDRVAEVFRTAPLDRIASELAALLVDRIAQKHVWRTWYMEHHSIEQVRIRPFDTTDATALLEAVAESFEDLSRWLSWCRPGYALDDARSWCTHAAEQYRSGKSFHFAVEACSGGQWHFAGGCGLTPMPDSSSGVAMLGYWTRSSLAGRGIAPRAAHQAIEFAFDQRGIERIEIYMATPNKASQRVAEKLGAVREAVLRSRIAVGGVRYDAFLYSILRSQWRHSAEAG